jgi:hypothetical protein
MKIIPNEFYVPYFELIDPQVIDNAELFREKLFELEILRPDDTEEEIKYFTSFYDLLSLFTKPFQSETFDFSDEVFLKILLLGERFAKP